MCKILFKKMRFNFSFYEAKIKEYESQLTGEFSEEQFGLRTKIADLRKLIEEHTPQKPDDSDFECVGCGS